MTLRRGFTLIELLVVVAIIGILASVVLASLNGARDKSETTVKKQELTEILKSLQMYYLDTGTVPPNRNNGNWAVIGRSYSGNVVLQELVDGGYISELPQSPDSGPYYYYTYGTYVIVSSRMNPPEYGPFPKGWHCSNYDSDKIWCAGFDL